MKLIAEMVEAATYAYDALNRLTSVDYPGTAEDIAYSYDSGAICSAGVGRLCQATDASGTTRYGYDAFSNVVKQEKTELGNIYTTHYTYDARDRVLTIVYPDGRTVAYTRDALGRIESVSATVNAVNQALVSARTYRPDGLLLSQAYGNGIGETRTYNLKGELTYQSLGSADTRLYGYDANGNLTSLQSLPQVADYDYDALDRLISDQITSTPASSRSFGYDANGNRTSDNNGIYTYASASNRLSQTPHATITLDAAGNTLSDGQYTYSYNQDGHLSSVTSGSNTLGSYTYNHLRQRTRKVAAQGTTIYHYDLEGNPLVETTSSGGLIRAYVWADGQPIAQISAGVPETLVYLHADHLATPRLGTNGSGTVVWSWEGEAYGGTLPNEDPDGDSATTTVNLRFPGQYHDEETGLHYNWNRYYDPETGRYMSSDPIGLLGGLNVYAYVGNNPLRLTDKWGLAEWLDQVMGVGPIDAWTANQNARSASAMAQASGLPGPHNGPQDAYRHCLWSCLMTKSIGSEQAKIVGDIHERVGARQGQPTNEQQMDDANNAVGRMCGLQDDSCEDECTAKFNQGELYGPGATPMLRTR